MNHPLWVGLGFLLAGAVTQFVRGVKSRRRPSLVAGLLLAGLAGVGAYVALRWPARPQLVVVNASGDDVFVGLDGRDERLVPRQEFSSRYDAGSSLVVAELKGGTRGERMSVPTPHGADRQVFSAVVRRVDGRLTVEFSPSK